MNDRPGTLFGSESLIGTWSVHDATGVFRDAGAHRIQDALSGLDRGEKVLSELLPDEPAGAPAITVEIRPAGEMAMTIVRSMTPDLPATMKTAVEMRWKLDGDQMTTQANPASLDVKIDMDSGSGLDGDRLAEARRKADDTETLALQGMKNDPLWNVANTVTVLHAGERTFLTKAPVGMLMLHVRK
jgi:hypothetical protein